MIASRWQSGQYAIPLRPTPQLECGESQYLSPIETPSEQEARRSALRNAPSESGSDVQYSSDEEDKKPAAKPVQHKSLVLRDSSDESNSDSSDGLDSD